MRELRDALRQWARTPVITFVVVAYLMVLFAILGDLFLDRETSGWGKAVWVIALIVLILHFTGWLKRNNLEWLVLVLAVATFPAVIFL